jgi:hypothetical protein
MRDILFDIAIWEGAIDPGDPPDIREDLHGAIGHLAYRDDIRELGGMIDATAEPDITRNPKRIQVGDRDINCPDERKPLRRVNQKIDDGFIMRYTPRQTPPPTLPRKEA